METLAVGKCSCGSKQYEEVDITPAGVQEKRSFTRCKRCGLVVAGQGNWPEEEETGLVSHWARVLRDGMGSILRA